MSVHADSPVSMDKPSSSTKSGTWWNDQVVLSLDGGGIRAYTSLIILEELMRRISTLEREQGLHTESSAQSPARIWDKSEFRNGLFLPCHYFHQITGTGMGGLIAVMIGRLGYSVAQAIEGFENVLRKMQTKRPVSPDTRRTSEENTMRLRHAIMETLSTCGHRKASESTPLLQDDRLCTVAVLTTRAEVNEELDQDILLRSYRAKENGASNISGDDLQSAESSDSMTLIEACLASIAAPEYFDSVRKGDYTYRDGSIRNVNPTKEVYRQIKRPLRYFISIGYDESKSTETVRQKSNDDRQEFQMQQQALELFYERLSCVDPFTNLPTEDWTINSPAELEETLQHIKREVQEYIDSNKEVFTRVAKELVKNRLLLTNTVGWEAYAQGVVFKCQFCVEAKGESSEFDSGSLRSHLIHTLAHRSALHGIVEDIRENVQPDRFWEEIDAVVFKNNHKMLNSNAFMCNL